MTGGVAAFGAFAPPRLIEACVRLAGAASNPVLRAIGRKVTRFYARRQGAAQDVEAEGLRLRVYPRENHLDWVAFVHRSFRSDGAFAAMFDGLQPDAVVVDIGANSGFVALTAARRLGPAARILAFEPHPVSRARLLANLALNGAASVEVVPLAVSDADGPCLIAPASTRDLGTATLAEQGSGAGLTVEATRLLPALQARGVTRIDLLKIDVEGHEDRALGPFFEAAPQALWPARLFMEHKHSRDWRSDLLGDLSARGYAPAFRDGVDVLLTRAADAPAPALPGAT